MASLEELREQTVYWLEHPSPYDDRARSAWVLEGLRLSSEACRHVHAHHLTSLDRMQSQRVFALSMRLLLDENFFG